MVSLEFSIIWLYIVRFDYILIDFSFILTRALVPKTSQSSKSVSLDLIDLELMSRKWPGLPC